MESICEKLVAWYRLEGRDLPWRATRDAYRIWLSEVILQQTRVEQGLRYYHNFVHQFPRVELLASASEDQVLKLWQGLGYYSRARNLHAAARQIVTQFAGHFPSTYDEVRSLKGVGDYTAAAICAFAYDLRCAVVDGNVYRVLSRLYDLEQPIDSAQGKKLFRQIALDTMHTAQPSVYNQAIMDFGALVCTPQNPRCDACPLSEQCLAYAQAHVALRPVKQQKTKVRSRWFSFLDLRKGNERVLVRRAEKDIWQGLYEFPLIEHDGEVDFLRLAATDDFKAWVGTNWHLMRSVRLKPHRLSHQLLHAVVYEIEVERWTVLGRKHLVGEDDFDQYCVPRLLELYLQDS